jgi:predicted  nucleic acid-binding Zn-ribbon protein
MLARDLEMEFAMDGHDDSAVRYSTPYRVQAWFLARSRDNWKRKYQNLKAEAKRLQNRVNDVTKSREKWREQAQQLRQHIQELEARTAALQQQTAALKKDGPAVAARSG